MNFNKLFSREEAISVKKPENQVESGQNSEDKEVYESKVVLELFRHGQKEVLAPGEKKADDNIRLSEKGRSDAAEKSDELEPNPEVAVAFGSPKERTQETAMLAMLANEGYVDPNASLEVNLEKIREFQKVGKKVGVLKELDFTLDGPAGAEAIKAFKENRLLKYYVNESDRIATETNDANSSTATRFAGNIAQLINHYTKVGTNFNRIAESSGKYEVLGNQLERYFGTHQTVGECFLARVIEKTEGKEAMDKFVESLGGGFKELQGINIEIINRGQEQRIVINYDTPEGAKSIEVDEAVLDELMQERDDFENKIKEKINEKK